MRNRVFGKKLRMCVVALAMGSLLGISGCAMFQQGQSGPPQIQEPDEASMAPDWEFSKIHTLAVLPLSPVGQTDEQFADNLSASLTSELQQRQSQWKIIGEHEVITAINANSLTSGFKNLQADFNTFGGNGGQMVTSAATKEFLQQLGKATGADGFLIGTYKLTTVQIQTGVNYYNNQPTYASEPQCKLELTLFDASTSHRWWTAVKTYRGERQSIINALVQTMATYLGKGTLRQL